MKARRSNVKIIYEGKDITGDLAPYLKGLSFTDSLDKADSVSFSLSGDKWINEWPILKGDKFQVEINVYNWKYDGDNRTLQCGTFTVDDISFSGTPDVMTVSGNSIDITTEFKGVSRDNTWENISLKEIAQEIAARYSMNLFYDCDEEFLYDKIDQLKESDSGLLSRLAEEQGFKIKIMDNKLIIFDEKKYEDKETVAVFQKGDLTSYDIQCDDLDVYDACEITYFDPVLGEQLKGSYEAPASSFYKVKTGKVYYKNIDTGVVGETKEEKEKYLNERAKKMLRNKNKNETKVKLNRMGDPGYYSGMTAEVKGFGRYDGIYLVTSVGHSLQGGYKSSIEARRRLDF